MPDPVVVYCICRSSDIRSSTTFMIACDSCDEWFHGDCINMSKTESNTIEKYFCMSCIGKNPVLKITYKPARQRKSSVGERRTKDSSKPKRPPKQKRGSSPSLSVSSKSSKSSLRKTGGTGTAALQDAPNSSSSSDTNSEEDDDWETAEGSSRRPRLTIDTERQNGNSVPRKPQKRKTGGLTRTKKRATGNKKPAQRRNSLQKQSGSRAGFPGDFGSVQNGRGFDSKDFETIHGIPPPLPIPSESSLAEFEPVHQQAAPDVKKLPKIGRKQPVHTSPARASPAFSSPRTEEEEEWPGFDMSNLRQCFGPGCCFAAAPQSKYCSDDCGRALARKRLYELMPIRLQQRGNPVYAATLMNQKEVDSIRKKLEDCKIVLEGLTARKTALENTIKSGKMVNPVDEKEEDEEVDNTEVSCITCGQPIPLRTAVKHFERCFNRFENQTSYGSTFMTAASSNIFCDVLNPKTSTYCKRLKVLCPEHLKELTDDNEVCGFPLHDEYFRPTGKHCHLFKKNCSKHPSWERIKRAEIDLETLRTWIKMDELVEQERSLLWAIQCRGGIVQSMTNYTIIHSPEAKHNDVKLEDDEPPVDICSS